MLWQPRFFRCFFYNALALPLKESFFFFAKILEHGHCSLALNVINGFFCNDVADDAEIISFQDISNINEDSITVSDDQDDPLMFDSFDNSGS